MQTAIFSSFGYPLHFREGAKMIRDTGFDRVMLWWEDQKEAGFFVPKEAFADIAREEGLFVENVHADFLPAHFLWRDVPDSEEVVKQYLSTIDGCASLEIPIMILHLTSGENPPPLNEMGMARIMKLVERAEQKNVIIALENIMRNDDLTAVYDRIDSDKLKFCYDSGHENCFTREWDVLNRFGDKLVTMHLHDNDGANDQHWIPGEGTMDFQKVAGKLKKMKYQGAIGLEVSRIHAEKWSDRPPEEFLAEAYKKAIELVNLSID